MNVQGVRAPRHGEGKIPAFNRLGRCVYRPVKEAGYVLLFACTARATADRCSQRRTTEESSSARYCTTAGGSNSSRPGPVGHRFVSSHLYPPGLCIEAMPAGIWT